MNEENTFPGDDMMEAYFEGRLTTEECAVLELQMADDPEVAREMALYQKVVETTRFARKQQLREQFNRHFNTRDKSDTPESQSTAGKWYRLPFRWWLIAVSMLLVYSITFYLWGLNNGRHEQAVPQPGVTQDTNVINKTPADGEKDTQIEETEQVPKPRTRIIAMRIPPKEILQRSGTVLPTDTLGKIEMLWLQKDFSGVLTLASDYLQDHDQVNSAWELYADAAIRKRKYPDAERAYLRLAEILFDNKVAKWNLLVCYALQLPAKESAYKALSIEIDGWGSEGGYNVKLKQLQEQVEKL